MTIAPPETLYTAKQISERCGVHIITVYVWIRTGRLAAIKLGRRSVRVRQSVLYEFLEQHGYTVNQTV